MSAGIGGPSRSRVTRCWVTLLLMGVLAGCATTSGGNASPAWSGTGPRFSPAAVSAPAPRLLLAMGDGPATPGGEPSGPVVRGYSVPGRNPDSEEPYKFFLGNAAHRLITFMYGVNYPESEAYYNTVTIKIVLGRARIGDASRLRPGEPELRPDITDATRRILFEIKPWNDRGLEEGRQEARTYLEALNRGVLIGRPFVGGMDFHGEILIHFAGGQFIWRLEWRTTEPGVVQYQWTRSEQRFESEAAAYEAGRWVALTRQEMRQYGGWVGQAVEGMVNRRERLATFSGVVGIVIDTVGDVATAVFSTVLLNQMGSGASAQQPPAQGGGQVIPFPPRPPPAASPAQLPAAGGMPLPR